MNDPASCDRPCAETCPLAGVPDCHTICPAHAPASLPPIDFAEAQARFRREAARGVCDTGRYRLAYYVWGAGPPLLFIHGVSDNSESFAQPISRLAAHFRCVAYDLPTGRGDGACLARYTHADLVSDLWALLDHLCVSQSYIFGSSFGATVALAALRREPRRLPRAVLQGAVAWRPLRRAEKWLVRAARYLPGTMRRLPYRDRLLDRVHRPWFAGRAEAVYRAFLECTGRTPIRAFGYQALLLDRCDLRPVLPEVRQPVLLVGGERETAAGKAREELLRRGLPNAGRVTIDGCGHLPYYTHPEVLAEVVRRFLTPPEGAARGPVSC